MVGKIQDESSKEEEPFGLACALDYFSENEEVFRMVDNLKTIVDAEPSTAEKTYEKFLIILNQYIEQPHLLDSHLDQILEKFIDIVRDPENPMKLKHLTLKYMFVLVNVRGHKVIVTRLPHEVADFEVVLQLLEAQDPNDPDIWTTRYILLLWLSIIVMIPFHMSRFDGFDEKETCRKTVMNRIINIIKTYAVVADKCRDAAAQLSYRFITRNDVKELYLKPFFDWAIDLSLRSDSNVFMKYGTLACVATIIKHGKRDDILPHSRRLLEWITNSAFKSNSGAQISKLVYKIIQRIGLIFLPPRLASWRYKRGNRSLAANLSAGDSTSSTSTTVPETLPEEEDDDIEVPDEVEEVIDQLIQGLRSTDGIVRWSAAKGVGRVTGRLPKDLADEVVGSVLELLGVREGDGAWHGGCLALAELGRRGLLLPERLPHVVPLVLKALVYDEPRGYSSVGSHIRDAACYVCWSFARAYEPHTLAPYVRDIASTLLVVTCFDKEINCRRAASAAFQENVGRQGTFPHGIDILTTADFFSVSARNNAYLNISVYIAQFEEYTLPLIEHLVTRKVDHWDSSIRELAAKALHNLTPKAPKHIINIVLPALFEKTNSIDLNCRHGSVLAIGEVVYSLSKVAKENNSKIGDILGSDLLHKTKVLIPGFREKLCFRGLGGELMKQACSDFIEKCSLSALPFHNEDIIIDDWLSLLNECLSYEVVNIRTAAINALPVMFNEYFSTEDRCDRNSAIIEKYVAELLSTTNQVHRMGHALALGSLPKFMIAPNLELIINSLVESTYITTATLKWAESRRDAVKSLTAICVVMKSALGKELSDNQIRKIYHTFFEGLTDYTQDKRGDIGAWMREASVTGLQVLTLLLAENYPSILNSELMNRILSGIAQQAVEKIDRTRALAGKVFCSFLYHNPRVPNITHYKEITLIFPEEECGTLNWNSGAATFPKFVQLLQFPPYTYSVLLGLICSVGGMTESLVKNSCASLFSYLKKEIEIKGIQEMRRLCDTIYQIFIDFQKVDRITVPMFRFLDKLFDSGCLDIIVSDPSTDFLKKILKLVQVEIAGCKDIYKLMDGINVLCQFIQIKGEICNTALVQLSILLCHRQSYVRRSTSTKLYESLLVYGDNSNIDPEKLDEAMQVLSNTNWEDSVEEVRLIRNELCALMGIRVPVAKKKVTQ